LTPAEPTTAELRESFNRAPLMRLRGWTFERACAAPLILWALKKSALARRRSDPLPTQGSLL
jgi:hypothetical protein